ncbi:MoaD/ThiS family protein [Aliarcobacter cibarius]|uniref:ThiS family protein n=1 Tax=Aliarcobacter cibarius TaxID=255507 RepID=A0A7L5JM17_9BACT|nr:MoaD/ThiS family protein [Aliarcobacter cibarius]QKJ26212.1 ThiS family protein [Aliarcobacter cibarius]TLS97838.1 MoaD/ThiS family protein [Aliarcobacter cibarius]TLS98615.1 MoaD/ThiS family protein [Aliarcobacter cibarius]TLT02693.1 MoaD/ThiS family protein [Aliarcobacter cibarius]
MAIVYIPTALRLFTDGTSEINLKGESVAEVITSLVDTYSDLKTHLFTNDGKLRSFVNIYLNEEDIRHLDNLNTKTSENDKILLVPSIAGGI